jgi:hypothetical protein
MSTIVQKHKDLTVIRSKAYMDLFGCQPSAVFPCTEFAVEAEDPFPIDVFVFTLAAQSGDIDVAVTNGMSNQRMVDADDPEQWARRELIQYFPTCTKAHARRLHRMAWVPLEEGFLLDTHHSVAWEQPAIEGTPWKNGFFLLPLLRSHREFAFEVEGDKASLLWHIPISDAERDYKKAHGSDALIERMEAVKLPWIFDERNRPPLV